MNILTPRKALNKAFLKQKVYREEMERFKTNLLKMLHDKNENESEEYHKNLLSAFLRETWYKDLHFINTRERTDLVIHEKASSDSAPAVLIETKKPGNKSEMPSKDDLNAKALHELIRYYLHERVDNENKFIKHLIVTDLNAFFIFDENEFDKYVYGNRQVLKDYEEYKNSGKGTDFFYTQVARPLVADIGDKLTFTCFEVKEFQRYLKNGDPEKEKKLIPYYKLLAPEHLLKKPFANDSNTLDRHFYNELLHIIGLKEVKQGSQKLIQRAPEAERQPGSLVENAINILQSEDIIGYFKQKEQYGSDRDEQAFNIALELVITWINRILFLKLLEAQLVRYHRGDAAYKFLNIDTLPDYDALNKLFFQVLAVEPGERSENVREHFSKIPYLNSSLFEPNELERNTIRISNLEDEFELPYLGHTVLKDSKGKRRSGKEDTLRYLFEFLEAYDFASEGSEDIQEENKNLINASVLGLIFEKINGYRDGSFFTPGFITEYMARETIRRAVVQKFNEVKGWQLDDFEALKEKIEPDAEGRAEANRIINSLKVVDPAVGSGHFLVSALNEIIALKSELKVLSYRSGDRIKLYQARVENDELIVEDHEEGGIFEYNLSRSHTPVPEKQALQEALFHEKQTIIENCLFGVDINPNSVKICRLRLWIELLKNAYYKEGGQGTPASATPQSPEGEKQPTSASPDAPKGDDFTASTTPRGSEEEVSPASATPRSPKGEDPPSHKGYNKNRGDGALELQTLPNIDINIKAGNSLVSRFALDTPLDKALRNSNWNIRDYRNFVQGYKNPKNKEERIANLEVIKQIKKEFSQEIHQQHPKQKKLDKFSKELYEKYTGNRLFEEKLTQQQKKDRQKLEKQINKLQTEIDELKNSEIYRNAFEWRFEFPEVLDDEGNFKGFDVAIGNPPYIRQEQLKEIKPYLSQQYEVFKNTADILVYFVELGLKVLKQQGVFSFIISNKFLRATYGEKLRNWLKQYQVRKIIDFGDLPVFEEASTYPMILAIEKRAFTENFQALNAKTLDFDDLQHYVKNEGIEVSKNALTAKNWNLIDKKVFGLIEKIMGKGVPLSEYVNEKIFYGIKTGLNEAFVIDEQTKNGLIEEDEKSSEIIKPFLAGRDIKRYQRPVADKYLILIPSGFSNERYQSPDKWAEFEKEYPAVARHLKQYEQKAKNRYDKGEYWWELRGCDYYDEFEKPKIMLPDISLIGNFTFDENGGKYLANTAYIIGSDEKYLLGILASSLVDFFYRNISASYRGGYLRFIYQYLAQIPIANATTQDKQEIEKLVADVLDNKSMESNIEAINRKVYELYGLTEEEIGIVEGSEN